MGVLAAIDGVEDHIAVGLHPNGGAGGGGDLKVALGLAVGDQQVQRAHGLRYVVPAGVRGGEGHRDQLSGYQCAQECQPGIVAVGIYGQQDLILPQRPGGGILHDLLHLERHLAADGDPPAHNGGQDVDAIGGDRAAGGVVAAVAMGQHCDPGLPHPGFIDGGNGHALGAGTGGDLQLGLAYDGAPVGAEPYGVVAGGAGEKLAGRDEDAQGVARGGVVEIAVDRAYHPVADALIISGSLRDGQAVAHGGAVGRHRDHRPAAFTGEAEG